VETIKGQHRQLEEEHPLISTCRPYPISFTHSAYLIVDYGIEEKSSTGPFF
jgi:hypothetical protein